MQLQQLRVAITANNNCSVLSSIRKITSTVKIKWEVLEKYILPVRKYSTSHQHSNNLRLKINFHFNKMNNYEEFFINIFQSKIITLSKGFLNYYQRHFVAETSGEAHVKRKNLLSVCLFRDIYGQKKSGMLGTG